MAASPAKERMFPPAESPLFPGQTSLNTRSVRRGRRSRRVVVQLDDTEDRGCLSPGSRLQMTADILAGFGRRITWQPVTNNFLQGSREGKHTVDICVTQPHRGVTSFMVGFYPFSSVTLKIMSSIIYPKRQILNKFG